MSMFTLTNARGETVDINNDKLLSYTPTGLGVQFKNTYSQYETYFKATKSTVTQGQFQINILFGDVESQSYQTFSDFAQFLAYQPLTLTYTTDSGTWYRDGRLNSLTKTEIGGSTVFATDRINEIFTLEFINSWYNNKSAEYKSYDPDPNLGTYGKIYRPEYDPYVNRNLFLGTKHFSGNSNWAIAGNLIEDVYQGLDAIQTASAWGGPKYNNSALENQGVIQSVDDTFIMSAWVRNTGTTPLSIGYYNGFTNNNDQLVANLPANSDWIRISSQPFKFKQTSNLNGTMRFEPTTDSTDGYVQQVGLKLEKGSIATDWTPAPEDNLAIPFGYAYAPYYVYQESNRPSNEKVMSLNNKSQYFGLQSGSPSVITVKGPCSVNPTWTVVQKGNVVATDGFVLTLTDNQKLVVSSYPEDQYARLYNPDGSYVDVSQLQDYTKTNFVQIPEGESTVLFYLDADSDVNITFKEERLLV